MSKVSLFLVLPVTLICWIRYWFSLEFHSLAINFTIYRTISQHLKCPLFYLEVPLLFLPLCRWILIIIWGPAQMSPLRWSLLQNELLPPHPCDSLFSICFVALKNKTQNIMLGVSLSLYLNWNLYKGRWYVLFVALFKVCGLHEVVLPY